jgi:large subunit ribosomal protein L18
MARDSKNQIRMRIHARIRRRVEGTPERPRLAVFRSVKHIYAQVIDDSKGHTVVSAASTEKAAVVGKGEGGKSVGGNLDGAKAIGKLVAERAKDKGIKAVVFDRGGYHYHGRVKALAEAAREAGLEF